MYSRDRWGNSCGGRGANAWGLFSYEKKFLPNCIFLHSPSYVCRLPIHQDSMYSKELLKGTLKPIILKLLKENGKMYGYEIAQRVKAMSEEKILIKEGSLYPSLHSMAKDGLLEIEAVQIGNRTRKYYRLTQKGEAKVPAMVQEVRDFIKSLNLVLQLETSASC